jgi:hypothetical protein
MMRGRQIDQGNENLWLLTSCSSAAISRKLAMQERQSPRTNASRQRLAQAWADYWFAGVGILAMVMVTIGAVLFAHLANTIGTLPPSLP